MKFPSRIVSGGGAFFFSMAAVGNLLDGFLVLGIMAAISAYAWVLLYRLSLEYDREQEGRSRHPAGRENS